MADQEHSTAPQQITLQLEIVPEDGHDADAAAMNEIGLDVKRALEKDGYTVRPVPTGERGGVLLLIAGLELVVHQVWVHKDQIFELFKFAAPVVQYVFKERDKRAAKEQHIKVAIKIDGASIDVEADDVESAEQLMKLANSFRTTYPQVAATVTPQSTVTVQGRVPKAQRRRTR